MKNRIKALAFRLLPIFIYDTLVFLFIFKCIPWKKDKHIFNQKVIWRKYFDRNYLYTRYSDKILVRDYVERKIGPQFLIPKLGVYNSIDDLSHHLQERCVIKANHGAGMNLIIGSDHDNSNDSELLKEIESWFDTDYSDKYGEFHYRNIERRVLVEENLSHNGCVPSDYKFHSFKQRSGKVEFVLQVVSGRFSDESRAYYVDNFEQSIVAHGKDNNLIPDSDKPILLNILELNKQLLGDFDYARIDWYISDGRPYFGEMTFVPGGGMSNEFGEELEKIMSKKWELFNE